MDLETEMSMAWAERTRIWERMFQASVNAPGLYDLNKIREEYQKATAFMRMWDVA